MRQDPGKYMVARAKEHIAIPEKFEEAAAKSLQLGYGMTSGALEVNVTVVASRNGEPMFSVSGPGMPGGTLVTSG